MDDVIRHLEVKIQQLIQQCQSLKEVNEKLRLNKTTLTQENAKLLAKHKIAIAQIETMVSHLKSIEKPQ